MSACSWGAAGPVGHTAGLPVRSWGGKQSASAHVSGMTRMWRYCTPGWNVTSSSPNSAWRVAMTAAASSVDGWPPEKSTMVPSSPTVARLQR